MTFVTTDFVEHGGALWYNTKTKKKRLGGPHLASTYRISQGIRPRPVLYHTFPNSAIRSGKTNRQIQGATVEMAFLPPFTIHWRYRLVLSVVSPPYPVNTCDPSATRNRTYLARSVKRRLGPLS